VTNLGRFRESGPYGQHHSLLAKRQAMHDRSVVARSWGPPTVGPGRYPEAACLFAYNKVRIKGGTARPSPWDREIFPSGQPKT
jgi:hypothetical protein